MDDVKKIRKRLNMTQKELAEKMGVNPRTVQNWENGKPIPESSLNLIRKLDEDYEKISSSSGENGISVSAAKGSKVNVRGETARLISLLEHSQQQLDKRDQQIDRLIALVERLSANK